MSILGNFQWGVLNDPPTWHQFPFGSFYYQPTIGAMMKKNEPPTFFKTSGKLKLAKADAAGSSAARPASRGGQADACFPLAACCLLPPFSRFAPLERTSFNRHHSKGPLRIIEPSRKTYQAANYIGRKWTPHMDVPSSRHTAIYLGPFQVTRPFFCRISRRCSFSIVSNNGENGPPNVKQTFSTLLI